MGMHLSAEVYEIFERTFKGKEEAKKLLYALEEVIVNNVQDTWYRTKEELKAEVFSEFATRKDLEQVRTELIGKIEVLYEKTDKDKTELLGIIKQDKAELLGIMKQDKAELLGKFDALYEKTEKDKAELLLKMEQINKKFSIYFLTLVFVIIFLNQNALEFIGKIIGIIK